MEQIILQKPDNISYEEAEVIFKKNNDNIADTLIELWNITPSLPPKITSKWDEIRETCDAYDTEMEKVMKQMRNNNIS